MGMKNILTLFIIFFTFIQGITVNQRIVGGKAAHIKDYPHQLSIIVQQTTAVKYIRFKGGAAIVSSYWALTAAHCIEYIHNSLVRAGLVYLRGNTSAWEAKAHFNDHKVISTQMHPDYNKYTIDYDLALVKVRQPFTGKFESPIKVAGKSYRYPKDARVTVTGWGWTDNDLKDPEPRLRQVNIKIIDHGRCSEIFANTKDATFTDRMLCAWDKGKDACVYDSGGPLIHSKVLIGIVSWGMTCASETYPGVYTNVSRSYDWIKQYEKRAKVSLRIRFVN